MGNNISSEPIKKPVMITKSTVLKRGWSLELIHQLLGEPDKRAPNPHYKAGSEMCLYYLDRVTTCEESKEYKNYQSKHRAKKEAAQKGVVTKKKKLLEYINDFNFNVIVLDRDKLIKKACASFNNWQQEKQYTYDIPIVSERASIKSDITFLNRICVNYLRHRLSKYETYLDNIFGKTGKSIGYTIIRNRILDEIAQNYPYLKEECKIQRKKMAQQHDSR